MKRTPRILSMILCILLPLCGCGKNGGNTAEAITNMKIPARDVTEFYYTRENINFGAFYIRYRLYTENGKYFFFHEKRERPQDYGPATEEDITASGTVELSPQEWAEFFALLKDGKVTKRKDSAEAGSSGPWTYIYWKKDRAKYQVYTFASDEARAAFEEKCAALAETER